MRNQTIETNNIKKKTIKYKTKSNKSIKIKIVKSAKLAKKDKPLFRPTEGEDVIEANLSFLISVMGGSLYDIYVNRILNERSGQNIQVTQVRKPTDSKNLLHLNEPTIFYGKNETHFTCSPDLKELWDSYKSGIQQGATNHFCQTFALMRMEKEFLPDGVVGRAFLNLEKGKFFENAFIAKNVACHILNEMLSNRPLQGQSPHCRTLQRPLQRPLQNPQIFDENDDIYSYFDFEVNNSENNHKLYEDDHDKVSEDFFYHHPKSIVSFLSYCKNISIDDFHNSTFRNQINLS
jgi:hypothetical protein